MKLKRESLSRLCQKVVTVCCFAHFSHAYNKIAKSHKLNIYEISTARNMEKVIMLPISAYMHKLDTYTQTHTKHIHKANHTSSELFTHLC